jgi:hypothetical protein
VENFKYICECNLLSMKEIFHRRIINNKSSSAQYEKETQNALWLQILVVNFCKKSGHINLSRLKASLKFI